MFELVEDRGCNVEYVIAQFETYAEAEVKAYAMADYAEEFNLRNGNGDLWGYVVRAI